MMTSNQRTESTGSRNLNNSPGVLVTCTVKSIKFNILMEKAAPPAKGKMENKQSRC